MDGLLVMDKPGELTSHDVLRVCVIFFTSAASVTRERSIRLLRAFSSLLLGKATRLAQFLSGEDKEYDAIIRLGYATDTGDRTGKRLTVQTNIPLKI